jgi:hypothetical protein
MKATTIGAATLLTLVLTAGPVSAQVPDMVPIQGVLSDGNGIPLDGSHTVRLALYDMASGGTVLFEETQTVSTNAGVFTVHLGAANALDMSVFRGSIYLGVTVGTDAEMTPRLEFGTVPYAAYAEECASVPPGAIMFFQLASCPTGWTEFGELDGRVPIGAGSGTLSATHGAALGDQAARTISQVPSHTHSVDPPATFSAYSGTMSMAGSSTSSGTHEHGVWVESFGNFDTYGVAGVQNSTGGQYSNDVISPSSGGHSHNVSVSGANHRHTTDISAFNSGSTGAGSVDVSMPYVQLRACIKN